MKLWNKNEPVVGGWFFELSDGTIIRAETSGLRPLVRKVEGYMDANSMPIPVNLEDLIEDQICTRQPKDKCRYTKGAGDKLSKVIHGVAGAIDSVIGTNLETRARRCGGCGRRRSKMNQLSRNEN